MMTTTIQRDVVPRIVDAALASRVTVVQGAAGSGKTVILDQVAAQLEHRAHVIRVPLTVAHNSPPTFRAHLGASTRERLGAPHWVESEGISPADLGEYLTALTARPSPDTPVCILFDDLHLIHQVQVLGVIEAALPMLPGDVHVVLSTRARPPLLLAQFQSAGALAEFGPTDLAWTPDEFRALTAGTPTDTDSVLALTSGWVLPTLLLVRANARNRDIADFLAEEVFVALTPEQERVLEVASVLESFTEETASALTGSPSVRAPLEQLEDRSLLHVLPDPGSPRWSVPPVARAWLFARLQARDARRAGELTEAAGALEPALPDLSEREREVLELLDSELTVREIASTLHVSYHTAKTHIRSIYAKLGVTSRMAAVRAARATR